MDSYPFATILFFIGIILGGMPMLFKKVKNTKGAVNILVFLIAFSIVMLMTFISSSDKSVSLETLSIGKLILLLLCGMIASASMLLPGISGSFVLMLLGYYHPIINAIRELTKFQNLFHNIVVLGVAGIGILIGIIVAAKLIEWLLNKYEIPTYYGIIGFVIASIASIFITAISNSVGIIEVAVGIILMCVGIVLAKLIGDK